MGVDRDSPVAYDDIASRYNAARPVGRQDEKFWVDLVTDYIHVGDRILDLGCGNGRWAIPFGRKHGCQGIGADKSHEMLRVAQNNDASRYVQWCQADAECLPFPDATFDVVWMSHYNVKNILALAGFHTVSTNVNVQVYNSASERLKKARQRVESGLTKLTDEEFQKGLKQFEQSIVGKVAK